MAECVVVTLSRISCFEYRIFKSILKMAVKNPEYQLRGECEYRCNYEDKEILFVSNGRQPNNLSIGLVDPGKERGIDDGSPT